MAESTLTSERAQNPIAGWLKGNLPHKNGTWYFKDGKVKYKGELKDGNPHGKGVWYNKDGSIKHRGEFDDGEPAS